MHQEGTNQNMALNEMVPNVNGGHVAKCGEMRAVRFGEVAHR